MINSIAMRVTFLAIAISTDCVSTTAHAEFSMASLFTDHAVLQRDLPVPIWGTVDAGAEVTVKFSGQEKVAVTDSSGNWKVMLEPMDASFEPKNLTAEASNQPIIRLASLVVGEVWICSGQFNMAMNVSAVPEVAKLAKDADGIRCFTVKNTVAFTEQQRCEGQWVLVSQQVRSMGQSEC